MRSNRIHLAVNGVCLVALLLAGLYLLLRAHPFPRPSATATPSMTPGRAATPTPTPSGTGTGTGTPSTTPSTTASAPPSGSALTTLATLVIAPAGSARGYDRADFGLPYTDALSETIPSARNGCDQRNDIRRRDGRHVVLRPGARGCVVVQAQVPDPYTGVVRPLADTELEHVVALKNAWISGARTMTAAQRADIAGDPLNLILVGSSINASKGDKSAATWLPPAEGYRCAYVARQIAVKARYRLTVTPAEKEQMATVLHGCPAQTSPTSAQVDPPPLGKVTHPG